MRGNPTEWEVRVWRHLSSSQFGHKFRRRHAIFPYICDFFCPAKGLAVEIDGDAHDPAYDERRDASLAEKGFQTLRFSNLNVRDNLEGVILTIASALQNRPDRWSRLPHPNPSSEGGGLQI
jgi:very-short-patch-repair endonuclease